MNARQHDAALRNGWYSREVDTQVLVWNGVAHLLSQEPYRSFDEFDCGPFASAAVSCDEVAAALWNEIEGAFVPVPEPFGTESFWIRPNAWIVVCPVNIEEYPLARPKSVPAPFE
jgi:hypothetical protein